MRGVAFVVFRLRKVCSLHSVLDQVFFCKPNRLLKALHIAVYMCLHSSCRFLGLQQVTCAPIIAPCSQERAGFVRKNDTQDRKEHNKWGSVLQFNVQIRKHTMKTKFSCTRFLLHWPIRKLVNWGQAYLSKALLVTCEVAMEYMLALTYSPQVWSLQTLGHQHRVCSLRMNWDSVVWQSKPCYAHLWLIMR